MVVKGPRWVYVHEAHVIGIGTPYTQLDQTAAQDAWRVIVLPDWMSLAFLKRLTTAAIGDSDPIHYVTLVVPENMLIMGEPIKSFEMTEDAPGHWLDNRYERFQHYLPPTTEERLLGTRIVLDGVLIWGREDYPGQRKIVVPRVKIPKKLAEGIPALKDVNE